LIPVETIPEWDKGDKGDQGRGEIHCAIGMHCKNFCNWHNVPTLRTTIKKVKRNI
jgi:hypothetical protein